MKEQFKKRLEVLKSEFEKGNKTLADLEAQTANVRATLLRISGAIQVIEEELAKCEAGNGKYTNYSHKDAELSTPV